ncbi:MAG: HAMP domain-containing histidine kinase [Faecalibacterium sp.]|nr:HAMP domain-containing histidine kinase [Ruminococcus sp.]MCM1393165.1 HAMP domain-containing histidine kinase [Ruminococcus sp.]MCM1486153.1 HAMP domain-containing histidine kinase [Faecalibacterium sp.]
MKRSPKSKDTDTQKKKKSKRAKKNVTTKERMSTKIIRDFLRFNLFCFALLFVLYIILLLASAQYPSIQDYIYMIVSDLFGESAALFVRGNSFVAMLAIYGIFFVFSCVGYSISTLINFDKTWRSLSAILTDDVEVKKFSKNFSDVEIAIKDIKMDVFRNQQIAAQSESRKNDLVMYLAHDLKTPLTSVIGYLSLLDECPELPLEQRAKYIGITLEKAYRLEQLINEFFEITRFNLQQITLQRNRIDLGMMLSQIADEFYPMFKDKNLDFDIDIPQKIVMFADSDKIARVFDNLLKNAVNYCYPNTTIRIGARIINTRVVIKFRNLCDEIPQEKLDRLFDKFFRLDSSRTTSTGGSGLGLAIAKHIVDLHGGTIKAKSTTEHTDFTVVLPYVDASIDVDEFNINEEWKSGNK